MIRAACRLRRMGLALLIGWSACLLCTMSMADATKPDKPDTDDAGLIQQLENLSQSREPIKDLSATFAQRRYSPLLKKPIETRGTLKSVQGLTRWDTDKPRPSTMMVKADRLEVYDPEQKTLEVYPIEKRLGQLLANPQPGVDAWRKHFTLERVKPDALSKAMREQCQVDDDSEGRLLIRLTPRDADVAELIDHLLVVLDTETGLTRGMAWSNGEDERTEILFSKVKQNSGLKRAALRLEVPESTRVVYPLGPVPGDEKQAD